ncbi:small membrane protein YoaI [Enterobacter cancerogenus]
MNDPAFVDMLCISGTFFTITAILVASVLFLERHG